MEEALIAKLLGEASISAFVSTRINWQVRPQGAATLPAIVLQRVSGTPDITNDGPSGLIESRVQIDCWGATYESAVNTSRAVNAVLSGAVFTQNTIHFQGCFLNSERQAFEEPGAEAAERLHLVSLDYLIWHHEL